MPFTQGPPYTSFTFLQYHVAGRRRYRSRRRLNMQQLQDIEDTTSTAIFRRQQPTLRSPSIEDTLLGFFGIDSFLPGQREVITAVMSGKDCLVIWGGGKGKSLCYQLPSLHARNKITLVISPLRALM